MPGHNVTRQKRGKGGIGRKKPMRLIDEPDKTQLFAVIEKELGNCHFTVKTLQDNLIYTASLSGNVKKSGRVIVGDTVLIQSLSEDGEHKYQIICKYTQDQRKMLERTGKIVRFIAEDQAQEAQEDEDAFEFEDEAKKRADKDQLTIIQELYDESMIDNL